MMMGNNKTVFNIVRMRNWLRLGWATSVIFLMEGNKKHSKMSMKHIFHGRLKQKGSEVLTIYFMLPTDNCRTKRFAEYKVSEIFPACRRLGLIKFKGP